MKIWWNWVLGIALVCLLFIAIPISYTGERSKQQLMPMFDEYIEKFNKSYKNNPAEYATRFQHFVASVQEIDRLNSESRGPEEHRARFGLTRLSDMSKAEYKEIHLSDEKVNKPPHLYGKSWNKWRKFRDPTRNEDDESDEESKDSHKGPTWHKKDVDSQKGDNDHQPHNNIYIIIGGKQKRKKRAALSMQFDWRSKGVVGPVRDQGLCGACWAFSTVGAMESMAAINSGKFQSLSVQEAIDCAGLGNSGCAGGDICLLLDWLALTNRAVQTDKQYPLRLTNGVCHANVSASGVRVGAFTCDSFVGAEQKILEAISTHGPVAVAVNALSWQNYLGGVIQYHCSGAPADLNHAVQLVGYDLTADVPYYIAKNSWGPEFGNGGYLHLAIGNNICGLANEVATVDVV